MEAFNKVLKEMTFNFSQLSQTVMSHSTQSRTWKHNLALSQPMSKGGLPSDMVSTSKGDNQQCMTITTCSGKVVKGSVSIATVDLVNGVNAFV